MAALALLVVLGAVADAPFQARLLTRDEIAVTPIGELSVPQLELERVRVEDQHPLAPDYAMLGVGIAGSVAGLATGLWSIELFAQANGGLAAIGATLVAILGICLGATSAGLGISGGLLAYGMAARRDRFAERHDAIVKRLEAIRTGGAAAPLPESSAAAAELIAISDARPGYAAPVLLLAAGAGSLAGGIGLWSGIKDPARANLTDVALAVAFTCLGVAFGGFGAYFTVANTQERAAIDDRIAELKALPPPPLPVDDYWHF